MASTKSKAKPVKRNPRPTDGGKARYLREGGNETTWDEMQAWRDAEDAPHPRQGQRTED